MTDLRIVEASVRDPRVLALVDALTAELALGGYADDETFGYSAAQLESSGVKLVAAASGDALVGLGGVELQGTVAELKRFYVAPSHRGTGAAAAILDALTAHAAASGVRLLRLETGDKQHAALTFYRRHGFTDTARFPPYTASPTSVCLSRLLDPI